MTVNPKSENTMRLQEQFADLLLAKYCPPDTLTKDQLLTYLRMTITTENPFTSFSDGFPV